MNQPVNPAGQRAAAPPGPLPVADRGRTGVPHPAPGNAAPGSGTPGPSDQGTDPFAARKARDRGLVLPLVGLVLVLPPVADIFQLDARLFGVPVTAVYLFAVWAALIAGAAALAPSLRDGDDIGPRADDG